MFTKSFLPCFGAVLFGMAALTGCRSTGPDFTPPDGYTMSSRDTSVVNLYFKIHTNQDLTPERAAVMRECIEHYFRKSKRFSVCWRKDPSVEEDVEINVHFTTMPTRGNAVSGMGAKVTLSAMCNRSDGSAGDSLLVEGFSKSEHARNNFIDPVQFSIEKHFTDALNDALRKLQRDIERLYPISSKVQSFRCHENGSIEFAIPIGTNFGLSSRYEYLICCKTSVGFSIVGLAGGMPGAESSLLRLVAWNSAAPDFNNIYNRIVGNDKSLTDGRQLFVIARVRK